MTLAEICQGYLTDLASISCLGMTMDSRQVSAGDVFIAIQGTQTHAERFVASAFEKGAVAVILETQQAELHNTLCRDFSGYVVYAYQLAEHASALAGHFYQQPSAKVTLYGVTGTNGKSSICNLIANFSSLLGAPAGVLGTLGNGLFGQLTPALNTTGSPVEVQASLSQQQQAGAMAIAMEVSSHGLVQHRVAALAFDCAIFTNLSRDHLDYHGTMQAYGAAKRRLFDFDSLQHRVINVDDEIGRRWAQECQNVIEYGFSANVSAAKFFKVTEATYLPQGLSFKFTSSWGNGAITAPLYGEFNVLNLAATLAALLAQGVELSKLVTAAPQLSAIDGRMEHFGANTKPSVVVDYAHTPDALKQALQGLALHCQANLWLIFGCGGDRDKGKRAEMAQAAEPLCQHIILTDDNPRTESPEMIVQDILAGFKNVASVEVIHSREQAISYALTQAAPQDVILVAGKGHEDYQIFADRTVHFSDRECVSALLKEATL
ncbi:UDP-N-acetylmuramoyl-L-alanyl-D-glutamate--2,6-diaminopimelate ligase [Motilimonas pumila]|uniref:UDP-N-acetylmuramoyl-L-alanyl-D-glutamate--2,6-diaminopimelate ligase n=1 Tax=Motilimonas pumila TaxID=2303987 RepID=A0A418YII0_9GAMM|nr:UDP-N-acetylmuramoyl-L-alanyl-D-glutamate--2,6-diaminopimelate ligase [Motilimonas pumila]RJG50031.1 UDP-N-acetylmuramoyl-L-alanyl-D-glutamate--2,6-diaminopimelate ligase [Motilimonas pumila]